ncbi:BZIP68 [Scenedesmus sp. PABB004]|nr:BZIP68 [Scenedesmus sp. PABB004]
MAERQAPGPQRAPRAPGGATQSGGAGPEPGELLASLLGVMRHGADARRHAGATSGYGCGSECEGDADDGAAPSPGAGGLAARPPPASPGPAGAVGGASPPGAAASPARAAPPQRARRRSGAALAALAEVSEERLARAEKRALKNRESAARSRQRRQQHTEALEGDNAALRAKVLGLRAQVTLLQARVAELERRLQEVQAGPGIDPPRPPSLSLPPVTGLSLPPLPQLPCADALGAAAAPAPAEQTARSAAQPLRSDDGACPHAAPSSPAPQPGGPDLAALSHLLALALAAARPPPQAGGKQAATGTGLPAMLAALQHLDDGAARGAPAAPRREAGGAAPAAASAAGQLPAAASLATRPQRGARRGVVLVRAGGSFSESLNAGALGELQRRLAALRRQEAAEAARRARPALPFNVKMADEAEADHRLITSWHENAWSLLREEQPRRTDALQ